MRNLESVEFTCKSIADVQINDICVDKYSGDLWIATDKGVVNVKREGEREAYLEDRCFTKVAYVNHACICLLSGSSIMLVQLPDQIVSIENFDENIQDCVFSPDLSVGVILTENNNIFLISSEVEAVAQISLPCLRNEKTKFVNVGWGKEETQFKGSKKKIVNAAEEEGTAELASVNVLPGEITWREDSKYFAISWTDTNGPQALRRIHIFDNNGDLYSVGSETTEVESGLCWRPRIHLIAASKRIIGRFLKIVFFELNGLPHGEIDLLSAPECDKFRVGKIAFDAEEHVMAVLFLPVDSTDSSALPFVRLYTTSNYHWSIKGELSPLPTPLPTSPIGHISLTFGGVGNEAPTSTLHIAVSFGKKESSYLTSFAFASCIDRSAWIPDSTSPDPAILANIDGNSVSLTAFALISIPPPMAGSILKFPFTVSAISISQPRSLDGAHSVLVQPACTSFDKAPWFLTLSTEWKNNPTLRSGDQVLNQQRRMAAENCTPTVTEFYVLRDDALVCADETAFTMFHGQLLHPNWISPKKLCFVSRDGRHIGMLSKVVSDHSVVFDVRRLASLPAANISFINGLVCGPNEEIAIQTNDGCIRFACLKALETAAKSGIDSNFDLPAFTSTKLPFACNQLYAVTFKCQEGTSRKSHFLVGFQASSHRLCLLPWSSTLDAEGECVMGSCSSLALHSDFLLITNLENQLITLPLTLGITEFNSLITSLKKRLSGNFGEESSGIGACAAPRVLECGAKLVTVVAKGSKTVLQMPRGNIEDIHPRALVFNQLAPIFDGLRHAEAIETMRRHRINFNLLYDYNPRKFLSNIGNFVRTISSPEHITLLVSDLSEEDITKTEYNGFFGAKQLSPDAVLAQSMARIRDDLPRTPLIEPQAATKINLVCEALLKAMLPDTKKFILPILTCYIKKQPQEVEKGLVLLKEYKNQGDTNMWEKGLRHMQYYLQPVRLFHLALGNYDLDLAESLAERSQLDPKEYLPVLAQLRAITSNANGDTNSNIAYQHARIDLLLQRYSSALRGLHLAGPEHWSEFCDVVEKQKLFSEALNLLQQGSSQFSEISNRWAEALVASQRLVSAGEVHLRAGHFASAARLFITTHSVQLWRLTVDRVTKAKQAEHVETTDESVQSLSHEDICSQARKLANGLRSLGRFEEAASLYSDYLRDYENAACAAAEGGFWLEAHQWAEHATNNADVDAKVREISLKTYSDFAARVTHDSEEFRKFFDRLLEVRAELKEKALNAAAGFGDEVYDDTESELFSDAGSIASDYSKCSRNSQYSKVSGRSRKNRRKRDRKKWTTKPGSKYEEVALIQVLHTTITSCQRLFESVKELVKELWRYGLSEEATTLARQANSLLLTHRASLSIIWCNEITGAQAAERIDDEETSFIIPTRRYPFHEAFLLFPPTLTIRHIDCDFLEIKDPFF